MKFLTIITFIFVSGCAQCYKLTTQWATGQPMHYINGAPALGSVAQELNALGAIYWIFWPDEYTIYDVEWWTKNGFRLIGLTDEGFRVYHARPIIHWSQIDKIKELYVIRR